MLVVTGRAQKECTADPRDGAQGKRWRVAKHAELRDEMRTVYPSNQTLGYHVKAEGRQCTRPRALWNQGADAKGS